MIIIKIIYVAADLYSSPVVSLTCTFHHYWDF